MGLTQTFAPLLSGALAIATLCLSSINNAAANNSAIPLLQEVAPVTTLNANADFSSPHTFVLGTANASDTQEPRANWHFLHPAQAYSETLGYGFDLGTQPNAALSPYYFSVRVPQGNYRVTIEFGNEQLASSTTIKAESRRLYIQNLTTRPGEFIRRDFIVNVRNASLRPPEKNAPGGDQVLLKVNEQKQLHWDDKLTLEINGSAPQVQRITLEAISDEIQVPTVYLVGDSTVTDQPYEPAASWGQMLPAFFDHTVAVSNHAESGETLKSFIAELRLAKVLETLKAGDYLFIQFGHNDQKKQWPQTYVEANSTYQEYLKVFIAEARLRGATPVLITSMQRRTFDSQGHILNSHGDYPNAVRKLAKELQVALIDLDPMSVALYEALGPQNAPRAFNDNGKDATHHNNYGAYQLAQCIVQGIRAAKLPLAKAINPQFQSYDPAQPDALDNFRLQPSPRASNHRPDGN